MNRVSRRLSVRPTTDNHSTKTLMTRSEIIERYDYDPEPEKENKMETKDDDAIQMIEDSIEGIKGLDGYKEDEGTSGPVGAKGVWKHVPLVGGSDEVSRNVDFDPDHRSQDNLPPAQRFVDPRSGQHPRNNPVSNQRLIDHDKMNDLMRDMRVEMEKREQGEARRVSEAVEQVGHTGECTQKHYKDNHGIYGSDKRVKFTFSNNT